MLNRGRGARCLTGFMWGVLIAGAAACGTDGEITGSGEPGSKATSTAPTSPSPSEPEGANAALREALAGWVKADTGEFTQTVTFPGGSFVTSGAYRLSTRTSRISAEVESPDGQHFEFRLIGDGDVSYMNTPDWPGEVGRCWLRFTAGSVGRVTGMDAVAGAGGLPANVVALSYARGTRMSPEPDDDLVIGTVDLVSAASMFGSGVLRLFDDTTLAAPIAAEFTVVEGDILDWRMSGESLVAALGREGVLDGVSEDLSEGLREFEVEVQYREMGSATVDVQPPDRAHTMSGRQLENEGCAAAR